MLCDALQWVIINVWEEFANRISLLVENTGTSQLYKIVLLKEGNSILREKVLFFGYGSALNNSEVVDKNARNFIN